jgi:hypothetical protein
VLENTPEGKELVRQSLTPGAALPKDLEQRLKRIREARFFSPINPIKTRLRNWIFKTQDAITPLDEVILRQAAQEWLGPRIIVPLAKTERNVMPTKNQNELLLKKAEKTLSIRKVPHVPVKYDGHPAIQILHNNTERDWLAKLARGTFDALDETILLYSPHFLATKGAWGVYDSREKILLLPHSAILETQIDDTFIHELLHGYLSKLEDSGRPTHLHGDIYFEKFEKLKPLFSYLESGKLSFEEMAAYALDIRLNSIEFRNYMKLSQTEKSALTRSIRESAVQGELAAAVTEDILRTALEQLESHAKLSLDLNSIYIDVSWPKAQPKTVIVRIPIPKSGSGASNTEITSELKTRIQLAAQLKEEFAEINANIYRPINTQDDLQNFLEILKKPRATTLTYIRRVTTKVAPATIKPSDCGKKLLKNIIKDLEAVSF